MVNPSIGFSVLLVGQAVRAVQLQVDDARRLGVDCRVLVRQKRGHLGCPMHPPQSFVLAEGDIVGSSEDGGGFYRRWTAAHMLGGVHKRRRGEWISGQVALKSVSGVGTKK